MQVVELHPEDVEAWIEYAALLEKDKPEVCILLLPVKAPLSHLLPHPVFLFVFLCRTLSKPMTRLLPSCRALTVGGRSHTHIISAETHLISNPQPLPSLCYLSRQA